MHTLSLLPQLFFLAPFGYVLIRGALAALLFIGIKEQWSPKASTQLRFLIAIEGVVGIALALGLMAQAAAVLALIIFILWIVLPWTKRPYPQSTILLAIVLAIVIFISGAGLLAIDLPL